MSTPNRRKSRARAAGCSATPIPRWMWWGSTAALTAWLAVLVAILIVPSTPLLGIANLVVNGGVCVGVIVAMVRLAIPELFRRDSTHTDETQS